MGDGGDVLDALDLQAGGLQGADGRLPAGAGALDENVDLADASWAANGVDLREPLKPTLPDVAHAIVLPWGSVMVTIVLLKLDLMWAWACAMFFFSRRRGFLAPLFFGGKSSSLPYFFVAFFLPATVFLGPLRVRALVWVRWPRTGSPRRCRMPW